MPARPTTDDPAALQHRLDDYLQRLGWALKTLPEADRLDIVRETRAHFAERMTAGDPAVAFEATAAGFGPPQDYAAQFLDSYELTAAVADGSARAMLPQVLRVAGHSVATLLASVLLLSLYGTAVGLVIVAVLKPVFPGQVGLWYGPHVGVAALGYVDAGTATAADELLGYWLIPVNVALALMLYRGATHLLRRLLSTFIQPRTATP